MDWDKNATWIFSLFINFCLQIIFTLIACGCQAYKYNSTMGTLDDSISHAKLEDFDLKKRGKTGRGYDLGHLRWGHILLKGWSDVMGRGQHEYMWVVNAKKGQSCFFHVERKLVWLVPRPSGWVAQLTDAVSETRALIVRNRARKWAERTWGRRWREDGTLIPTM